MTSKIVSGNLSRFQVVFILMTMTLFLTIPALVSGQKHSFDTQPSKTYLIKLKDGSEFIGNVTSRDSSSIRISTESISNIQIPEDKIKSISAIESSNIKKGKYWFPNPNPTRYVFAPSAYNLKKGEGYYQNTLLFLNSFDYGLTNNISVGGGLEFLSTFSGLASGKFTPIFYLTSKVGFKLNEKFSLAGGAMTVSIPSFGSESRHYAGLVYGLGTFGNPDHNLTGGLSWGYIDGNFSETPVVNISGMTRISRRIALITDNWLIPVDENQTIFSYGIRFFGEKISVDLAFINNKEIAHTLAVGIPVVDFVVKF